MKTIAFKSFRNFGVAALLSCLPVASKASVYSGLEYNSIAATQRANLSYVANQNAANNCYNAFIGSDSSSAIAGYYSYTARSYIEYYNNIGDYYYNLIYALAFFEPANIASYSLSAVLYRQQYTNVANDYFNAYSSNPDNVTTPLKWGGNYGNVASLAGYQSAQAYNLVNGVETQIANAFSGSYYQHFLLYSGAARGLLLTYQATGDQQYAIYAGANDFANALAYANFYYEYGSTSTAVYRLYADYYFNHVVSYE